MAFFNFFYKQFLKNVLHFYQQEVTWQSSTLQQSSSSAAAAHVHFPRFQRRRTPRRRVAMSSSFITAASTDTDSGLYATCSAYCKNSTVVMFSDVKTRFSSQPATVLSKPFFYRLSTHYYQNVLLLTWYRPKQSSGLWVF